jgi:hypothetical protein
MSSAPPPRALSEQESPPRALSQWLQLMLEEIAAKREQLERARAEDARRLAERDAAPAADHARGASPG